MSASESGGDGARGRSPREEQSANAEIERRLLAAASLIEMSGDDMPRRLVARLAQSPRPRLQFARPATPLLFAPRRFVPAVAIAAVVAVLVAVPAPRRAVARWLGIGAVHVSLNTTLPTVVPASFPASFPESFPESVPASRPTPVGSIADSIVAAERVTGLKLPSSAVLGPPANVQVAQSPLPDTLIATWPVSSSAPQTGTPKVGARLWLVRSSFDQGFFGKFAADRPPSIESVVVGGVEGLFISGPAHVLVFIGPEGEIVPDTAQLAGNTVLWAVGDVTYRLEAALGRDAAVTLAESFS